MAKTLVEINTNVIEHSTYRKHIKFCEPRPEKKVVIYKKPRTPWAFPISLWNLYGYEYEGEQHNIIEDMFDFDFNRCQFNKDAKTDDVLQELRILLREYYEKMYYNYKNDKILVCLLTKI